MDNQSLSWSKVQSSAFSVRSVTYLALFGLSTEPTLAGRTLYISQAEMERLLSALNQPEVFISVTDLPDVIPLMVTETSPKGSATGNIPLKDVCASLKQLDDIITAPRAHWELQRFRLECDCKVPDFNGYLFSDF